MILAVYQRQGFFDLCVLPALYHSVNTQWLQINCQSLALLTCPLGNDQRAKQDSHPVKIISQIRMLSLLTLVIFSLVIAHTCLISHTNPLCHAMDCNGI